MEQSAVSVIKKKAMTLVAIAGPMTIDNIGELRTGLLRAFDLGKQVQLSLAAVTEVDLNGLQLICSAHRTSIVRGLELAITGCDDEAITSVAQLSGMLRHMGCAQDLAGSCVWKRVP